MTAVTRAIAGAIGLVWAGAWGAFLVLVWASDRSAELTRPNFRFVLDVATSGAERILATVVVVALAVIGLALALRLATAPRQSEGAQLERFWREHLEELDAKIEQMGNALTGQAHSIDSLRNDLERIAGSTVGTSQELR